MKTLLIRLEGPMQSWGHQSRFYSRDTGREPSKSGVVGLICAALGVPRSHTATIAVLAGLSMGVRVDREGTILKDFHTAGGGEGYGVYKANAAGRETVLSNRYYLSDAAFLVGLSGEESLLQEIEQGFKDPVWPLCLGRKAFAPGVPIWIPDGLCPDALEMALVKYPIWTKRKDRPSRYRFVFDTKTGSGERRFDHPVSYEPRRFDVRYVREVWKPESELNIVEEEGQLCTYHSSS